MRKVLTISRREYFAMVGTKAFLLTITMMPVLMFGGLILGSAVNKVADVEDKTIIVIDLTHGVLFDDLSKAADAYNESVEQSRSSPGEAEQNENPFDASASKYMLREQQVDELTDEDRLELSDQVRSGEIYAFVEIPPRILVQSPATEEPPKVRFYAQDSNLSPARRWLDRTLNELVKTKRLRQLGIDPDVVRMSTTPVEVTALGLFEKTDGGVIKKGEEKDDMVFILMPFGMMMLMFMVIFLAAQPMLESVLEEKSERIAEVLLGSVNPFQLMLGKLLGNVAGSLSIFVIYFAGMYAVAVQRGWTEFIPFEIAPWFIAFQIVAVLFFSSIFMAVGAAVNQLKEAQSMLLPIWMLLASPMFVWFHAIREPNGTIATWVSFFPPATPLMMVLRLSTDTAIPMWQPFVGLVVLILATLICLFLAARVYRIGILWQGKNPRISELFRWAVYG